MKKIVVLGALGYLGTELCRIYSGESWRNKIVAIDSKFVSERGKIIPARISAVSAPKQRKLSQAIKRARILALIPYLQR